MSALLLTLFLQDVSHARALMASEEFEEAARILSVAVSADPDSARLRYYLGVCYSRLGNVSEAIDTFETARDLSVRPNPAVLYELGSAYVRVERFQEAAGVLEAGRDLTGGDAPIRLQLGWAYYQLVEGEKAASEFRAVVEREPENALAHLYLGLSHAALGKLGEAEASFRRAIELDASRVDATLGLARVLSQSGRRDEARALFEDVATAAAGTGDALSAHNELGLIALRDGDPETALSHFEAVVAEDREHRQATYNLWLLYTRLGRLDAAEAMRERFESLRDDPAGERSLSRSSSRKP